MEMKNQKQAASTAEERMKLIAPLLTPNLDKAGIKKLRTEICERFNISERTFERYYHNYLANGFEGLKPQGRCNENKYKIPQELLDEAIQLRRELPSRSVPSIIQILELEGKAEPGFLRRTTLQDALERSGYSAEMMKIYHDTGYASSRFQRSHRHDLWQGDIKYGPVLTIGGKPVQTYFSCLIDDCTRYILHGEFYANMEQAIVEDTLHKAIIKYGAPRRIYFDNGSQYRTNWMKRACALMGIRLLYARPRNPQGKGKQERFNLTMDAFINEVSLKLPDTLDELNVKFNAWLSECYLKKVHSALGTTPEIAFRSDSMPHRFISGDILARAFLHCEVRKADKCGCISFGSVRYDIGIKYAGQKVDVVYDPANTDTLTIEVAGVLPFQVHKLKIGTKVAPKPERPDCKTIAERSRLLDAVSERHDANEHQRMRAISYSAEFDGGM